MLFCQSETALSLVISFPKGCYCYISLLLNDPMNNTCLINSLYSCVHAAATEIPVVVRNQLHIHSQMVSPQSSPYHPAVCRACGSPPRTCAVPPRRCGPRWRRRWSRGCRGCRGSNQGATPPNLEKRRGCPLILHSGAPVRQYSHLKKKTTDGNYIQFSVNVLPLT